MNNERYQGFLRAILDRVGVGREIENGKEDNERIWEVKMVETMRNGVDRDSGIEFRWKQGSNSLKTIFTRIGDDGKKDRIIVKKILSGVQVGEIGESWECIEVEKTAYERCSWFREALEQNVVPIRVVEKTRSGIKRTMLHLVA